MCGFAEKTSGNSERLVRKINCMATDVIIQNNILMACGPKISYQGLKYQSYARFTTMLEFKFWDLKQLVDSNLKTEDVKNRIIETENKNVDSTESCFANMVGSDVLITSDFKLIQRSFWA